MLKVILSDLSRTILFYKDKSYTGSLNAMHKEKSTDVDYNFWEHYEVNTEYLELIKKFQGRFQLVVFTSGNIQEYPPLKKILLEVFEGIINPESIGGYTKDNSQAYLEIATRLKVKPEEILFIDDDINFINAAKKAGLSTIIFDNNENLKLQITAYT